VHIVKTVVKCFFLLPQVKLEIFWMEVYLVSCTFSACNNRTFALASFLQCAKSCVIVDMHAITPYLYIRNTPVTVTVIISIKVLGHNQHTLCEQFYYVATGFDPDPRM